MCASTAHLLVAVCVICTQAAVSTIVTVDTPLAWTELSAGLTPANATEIPGCSRPSVAYTKNNPRKEGKFLFYFGLGTRPPSQN
eukprot:2607150-Rhodomonas_salina.1